MNALDILILALLLLGVIRGWLCGLCREVVSVVGFIAGLVVACMLYSTVGDWIAPRIGSGVSAARALAFILLWIGVPVGLSLLADLMTKVVETVKLGGLNRLGGALFGGLKYLIFLSCILNVVYRVHLMPDSVGGDSRLYHPVRALSDRVFDFCQPHVYRVMETVTSSVPDEE